MSIDLVLSSGKEGKQFIEWDWYRRSRPSEEWSEKRCWKMSKEQTVKKREEMVKRVERR